MELRARKPTPVMGKTVVAEAFRTMSFGSRRHRRCATLRRRASQSGISRKLCVMTRIARLFFIIAVMSAAGSCSIELAEKEADTKAMQLTDAYYSCVRTSFASQRPTMVDRNMAIDQAFMVCKTEGDEASSI